MSREDYGGEIDARQKGKPIQLRFLWKEKLFRRPHKEEAAEFWANYNEYQRLKEYHAMGY
jgi:hypothetical protein